MDFLVAAVIMQVLMALWLKWGETHGQDRLMVMVVNYAVASLLALGWWWGEGAPPPDEITLWLGLLGGVMYTVSLLLWMVAISAAGLGVATAFMRLSVLWPTLMSVLMFAEIPTIFQLVGVVMAFGVLLLLMIPAVLKSRNILQDATLVPLLSLFLAHGGVGMTQKLFAEWGAPHQRLPLLLIIFSTSFVLTGVSVYLRKKRLQSGDLFRGGVFGGINILANFFLLGGLRVVSGVIAFPFTNVTVIVGASLAGMVLWKEQPGKSGLAVIVLAAAAIVLMALDV